MTTRQFFLRFKKIAKEYNFKEGRSSHAIRGRKDGLVYCPITAVHASLNPKSPGLSVIMFQSAGTKLKLDKGSMYLIAAAADYSLDSLISSVARRYRKRLLQIIKEANDAGRK